MLPKVLHKAYLQVTNTQGKKFRLMIQANPGADYTLFCSKGTWPFRHWEYLDKLENLIFLPELISRHFGFCARWKPR